MYKILRSHFGVGLIVVALLSGCKAAVVPNNNFSIGSVIQTWNQTTTYRVSGTYEQDNVSHQFDAEISGKDVHLIDQSGGIDTELIFKDNKFYQNNMSWQVVEGSQHPVFMHKLLIDQILASKTLSVEADELREGPLSLRVLTTTIPAGEATLMVNTTSLLPVKLLTENDKMAVRMEFRDFGAKDFLILAPEI